ncbi:probable glucan 1,3-alpha-glucosidase [Tanacetum coccineum]
MKKSIHYLIYLTLFLSYLTITTHSWKKEEFRNCNQTPFCKRARSRQPHSCKLIPSDVTINNNGDLVAKLKTKQNPDQDSSDNHNPDLVFSLSVYKDGILRVKIDEEQDPVLKKQRFQVPDVVLDEFESNKLWLQRFNKEVINDDLLESFVVYLSDGYEVVLRSDPFEVFVREQGSGGTRILSFNSHGLFDFEQLRAKNEGEDWEERFRSHTDTRPYGPQSISFDVSFYGADFVYGIPEHATSLALKPTSGPGVEESEPYRLFNLDVFEYLHESPFGLYGSIPFMLSHGKTHGTSGFFWLNAAEMQIDVLGSGWDAESKIVLPSDQKRIDTLWMSEAGIVDVFFFIGPKPKDVVKQYASVTGTSAMPQLFATGYHQCRWNYKDEEDVKNVDSKFDEHDIPYDVLWLDIEHTDGKRYFTWDKTLFPNPEEMQNDLASRGRRMVTIVDPHIKRDEGYHIHKEASKNGYYVKDASGKDYDGWCWPGSSSYIDMVNPDIRSWWADKFAYTEYVGSTPSLYIWNDMNEPSVFNGPEVMVVFTWVGVLDDLCLCGVEDFNGSVGLLMRVLMDVTETGVVISGYKGGGWGLCMERNTQLMRDAIRVRYTLLPYFYTLFREANVTGVPVARPLWMEFPEDEATFSNDEAFMVGNGLLVQGVYTQRAKDVTVYLPSGSTWYDLKSGAAFKGGKTHKIEVTDADIPVFQRGGTIIPRKDRFRRSTVQMENDPYTLVIAVDSSGAAEGELYIDDGKSYDFKQGAYIHRRFTFSDGKLTSVNLATSASLGTKFLSDCTIERIILLGHSSKPKSARIEPSNNVAEVELGPLQIRSGVQSSVLTIRKPNVRVSDDWTIKLL